jgi:hypothetical protein
MIEKFLEFLKELRFYDTVKVMITALQWLTVGHRYRILPLLALPALHKFF